MCCLSVLGAMGLAPNVMCHACRVGDLRLTAGVLRLTLCVIDLAPNGE